MQQFEVVNDDTQTCGEVSTRRFVERLQVPGGWLYRAEISAVIPDPEGFGTLELAIATSFVPDPTVDLRPIP